VNADPAGMCAQRAQASAPPFVDLAEPVAHDSKDLPIRAHEMIPGFGMAAGTIERDRAEKFHGVFEFRRIFSGFFDDAVELRQQIDIDSRSRQNRQRADGLDRAHAAFNQAFENLRRLRIVAKMAAAPA
jgi:hypothetical protein